MRITPNYEWQERSLFANGILLLELYTVEDKRGHYSLVSDLPGVDDDCRHIKGLSKAKKVAEDAVTGFFQKALA